jgi:uncharacterized damage-inducible protein DinB
MAEEMNTRRLLDRIERSRAEVMEVLDRGDTAAERADDGGWTVKDHLFHLAIWEEVALARAEGTTGEETIRAVAGEAPAEELEDVDRLNERIRAHFAGEDLTAARARWDAVHDRLRRVLERLPDERLTRPFDSKRPELRLLDTIKSNTCDHYLEHLAVIRELV